MAMNIPPIPFNRLSALQVMRDAPVIPVELAAATDAAPE